MPLCKGSQYQGKALLPFFESYDRGIAPGGYEIVALKFSYRQVLRPPFVTVNLSRQEIHVLPREVPPEWCIDVQQPVLDSSNLLEIGTMLQARKPSDY